MTFLQLHKSDTIVENVINCATICKSMHHFYFVRFNTVLYTYVLPVLTGSTNWKMS